MIDKLQYDVNGFCVARNLFDAEEILLLSNTVNEDTSLKQAHTMPLDSNEREPKFSLWYDLRDNLYSLYIRDERIIDAVETLVGEPCYHYHSKIVFKEAEVGAIWRWHQDYGYWYYYGFLFPKLISCMIAIDDATIENGCLQVLRGSQCLGRLDHEIVGKQMTPDEVRLKAAEQCFEKVYVELNKGDVVFFHCNLLHSSERNTSPNPRRCLITSYNAVNNSPFKGYDTGKPHFRERQPSSTLTERSPAGAIKSRGRQPGHTAGGTSVLSE